MADIRSTAPLEFTQVMPVQVPSQGSLLDHVLNTFPMRVFLNRFAQVSACSTFVSKLCNMGIHPNTKNSLSEDGVVAAAKFATKSHMITCTRAALLRIL